MRKVEDKNVYEPEVLPPIKDGADARPPPLKNPEWERWRRTFAPIMVGILVDIVDFFSMGPSGLRYGFLLGTLAAFAIGSMYAMPLRQRFLYSIGAGLYCMMPFTERLPLATLVGLYLRFKKG